MKLSFSYKNGNLPSPFLYSNNSGFYSMTRSDNEDRARWRIECRNELSKHIYDKLGINILPTDVRLITRPEDPYKWSRLPGYEYLFQKHLSKHSTGAYITIYYGIGKFFEAVPADLEVGLLHSLTGHQEMHLLQAGHQLDNTGFRLSETIFQLENRITQLQTELSNSYRLIEAETQLKESVAAELEQTKKAFTNLQMRFRKLIVAHNFYRTRAHRLQKGFGAAVHKLCQQFQETTDVWSPVQ